jgi:dihydropteroate synthase
MSVVDVWHCGRYRLVLARPLVMGVVNVTPDSFSDGGRFQHLDTARAHAQRLIDEGADILDIGGESTRPGAAEVGVQEELDRVVPLIESLCAAGIPLSIDTSKPAVMRAALAAGASIVNDVRALVEPGAVEAIAASDCGVVLMHMQGEPRTMQLAPQYDDVVAEVVAFLAARRAALRAAGVAVERIALDPGFGFGKMLAHNLALLRQLHALVALGQPVLAGLSRKSVLGEITGRPLAERTVASAVAAVLAAQRGARILRVHDVAATRDALALLNTTEEGGDDQ